MTSTLLSLGKALSSTIAVANVGMLSCLFIETHLSSSPLRPRLVQYVHSQNILLQDITLTNSPDWTTHFLGCANVLLDGVTVTGPYNWPNNDGIDPDSSVNVTIRNCWVDTGDDAICPKSTAGYGPLKNLLVEDCVVRSRSCGVKFGSATEEDMTDILIRRVWVWDSNRGLGIQHRDAGNIHNVLFQDIVIDGTSYQPWGWWGASEGIWVTSVRRSSDQTTIGQISNIVYRNITIRSENGALFSSRTETPLSNITLTNIDLTIAEWHPRRPTIGYSPPEHDYRPTSDGPERVYINTDSIYFENVMNSTIENSIVKFNQPHMTWWGTCISHNQSVAFGVTMIDVVCVH
jgi:polygalacturonase